MNWTKIEKEYPKAWELFKKHPKGLWLQPFEYGEVNISKDKVDELNQNEFKKSLHGGWDNSGYNFRNLYDFFDEQGVVITVNHQTSFAYEEHILDEWYYHITTGLFSSDVESKANTKTRTEAETAAFERAFEILESKIDKLEPQSEN